MASDTMFLSSDLETPPIPSQPPSPPRKPHPRIRGVRSTRVALQDLSPNACPTPRATQSSLRAPLQTKRRLGGVNQEDARDPFRDEAGFEEIVRVLADGSTSLKRIDSGRQKKMLHTQVSPIKKQLSRPKLRLTMKLSEISGDDCIEVPDHHCIKLDNISPGSEFSVDLGEVPIPSVESSDEGDVAEIPTPTPSLSLDDQSIASPKGDESILEHQHQRDRHVSIADESNDGLNRTRFGTVFSDLFDPDDFDSNVPIDFGGVVDTLHTDFLRSVERGNAIEIFKLPEQVFRRDHIVREIFEKFEEHACGFSFGEYCQHNLHHASVATHVVYAPNVYENGAGLLGFLGSPLPNIGLWDKLKRYLPGGDFDPIGGLLKRYREQGMTDGWKTIEPAIEGNPSLLYRVFHDQLVKVDNTFKELGGRPVVVSNTCWVMNIVNAEQSGNDVDKTILEMLMTDSPSVSPTATSMSNLLLS